MKSLFKTVALITFFSALTRVIGFVFRIYLSRVVGAEGLGLYQAGFSVFMVLLTIVSSGIPLIISRTVAGFKVKKDRTSEGSLVASALVFSLLLSLALCLIVFALKNVFASMFTDGRCITILLILLPSLVTSAVYSVFRGALWGQGNYFALCITELYEQVLRIFICVLLLGSTLSAIENANNIAWSLTYACIGSAIFVVLLYYFYGGKLKKPQKKLFLPLLKQSSPITGIRVAGSFIQPLVALIIPARLAAIGYTSSQAMALYGIACGMTLPLLYVPTTIIGSLSTALIPDISTAVANSDKAHIEGRIRTSLTFALIIAALFVPVYIGVGERAGIFLYDNALSGSLLQTAAWVMLPMGLTNISSALLNSLGHEMKSFASYLIGAGFMFVALWFLPRFVGINALIWGMGISYVVTGAINLYFLKRVTGVKIRLAKPLCALCIFALPSAALSAFVTSLCGYVFPLPVTILIGCGVAIASFVLLAAVFGVVDIQSFWVIARSRFKKSHKLSKKV